MFDICPACGLYSQEKSTRPLAGWRAEAVCPHCGSAHPFLRLPLFLVSGASGAGKSALAVEMIRQQQAGQISLNFVHLESDILWRAEYNQPEENYRTYRNLWLSMAKNIGQAGRPVVLYGSGDPSQFEGCPQYGYFSSVQMLALVCAPEVLAGRLRARPAWRAAGSEDFINRMLAYNAWFVEQAARPGSPIMVFDTSAATLPETAFAVQHWLDARFQPSGEVV